MIHDFFKFIFYFIGLAPIMWELNVIAEPLKARKFIKAMENIPYEDRTDNQKNLTWCLSLYIIWVFVGLLGSQWILFLVIIGLSCIPKKYTIIQWLDACISFMVLLFILLNTYHFKINIFEYLKSLLWG
jgi:hypothetical protein